MKPRLERKMKSADTFDTKESQRMQKKQNGIWLGYDIITHSGRMPKPQQIRFWDMGQYKKTEPDAPFHYHADALLATAVVQLNPQLQNPFISPKMNYSFACESWRALEPHYELHARSQVRINALKSKLKPNTIPQFESAWREVWEECKKPWGFDLVPLFGLLESFQELEAQDDRPLLYNFNLSLSRECLSQMQLLHSVLFHLRSLIAIDHNSQVHDHTHEAAKIDSITDYLPKAEYVANDALLYWSFKKLQKQMPENVSKQMHESFFHFSHNGSMLIESLPKDFLEKQNWEQLEETLYLVQMDWLLGSDSGLLFSLREEIFGLQQGYDKIFYPDLTWSKEKRGGNLSINVSLDDSIFDHPSQAA